MVNQCDHSQPSSVMYLPLIDLDSTCIYSTLNYVYNHARKHQCTPVIRFDQLMWWNAHTIVEIQPDSSELHPVVICLGNFHVHMLKVSGIKNM